MSNCCLKSLKHTTPIAFRNYISEANLIYFGLEYFKIKHTDEFDDIMHIIKSVRVVGNDQNPVTFDVSGVMKYQEMEDFYL